MTYPNPTPDPYAVAGGYAPHPQTPAGGYGLPVPCSVPPAQATEQPLVTIQDIVVTRNWVVVPTGPHKLRGTYWTVQDFTVVHESIPGYAIVLAILGFFFLLGLLFLLIKERRYSGFVSVTVVGDGLFHTVSPPPGPASAHWAMNEVNRARALAATAA